MPILSIIVPIYNVEEYLFKCIDSILAQSFTDFELILVDDGSQDSSGVICEEYKKIDTRVKVLHKKNEGVSSARNAGINTAKGDYIAFVDPDDTVERNMYEILLKSAKKHDVDLVVCAIKTINLNLNITSISSVWEDVDCPIDQKSIVENLIPSIILDKTYSLVSVFNKLYKKSLFENFKIRFDEGKHFSEDARFNFTLLTLITSLVYINQPLYNYYLHQRDSLAQIFREDLYDYLLDNKNFLINLCEKYNLETFIVIVKGNYIKTTLRYMEDLVNRNILEKNKIRILSTILNDKEFNEDLKIFKSTTILETIIKYTCILKSEKLFMKLIKIKNKLRPFLKKERTI